MRALLGLLAGIVAGLVGMFVIGAIAKYVAPVHGAMRVDTLAEVINAQSIGALAMLLLSWGVGALAAMWAARTVARAAWPGWTLAVLLALALASTFVFALPLWFKLAAVLAPLIGGAIGSALAPLPAPPLADEADARPPA